MGGGGGRSPRTHRLRLRPERRRNLGGSAISKNDFSFTDTVGARCPLGGSFSVETGRRRDIVLRREGTAVVYACSRFGANDRRQIDFRARSWAIPPPLSRADNWRSPFVTFETDVFGVIDPRPAT